MEVTDRDASIIRYTDLNRFLLSTDLDKLIPESAPPKIRRRLYKLYHNGLVERFHNGNNSPMIYGLTPRGRKLRAERDGVPLKRVTNSTGREFIDHTLGVSKYMVALESACRRRGNYRLIYPDELLATASPKILEQQKSFMWETRFQWNDEDISVWIEPDKIYGLENLETGKKVYFAHEHDEATMPVVRSNLRYTCFVRKHLSYAVTHAEKFLLNHYGIDNFRVTVVTSSDQRIETMRDAQRRYTKDLCPPGLFYYVDRETLDAADDALALSWTTGDGKERALI